jgi:hypothetical protein
MDIAIKLILPRYAGGKLVHVRFAEYDHSGGFKLPHGSGIFLGDSLLEEFGPHCAGNPRRVVDILYHDGYAVERAPVLARFKLGIQGDSRREGLLLQACSSIRVMKAFSSG